MNNMLSQIVVMVPPILLALTIHEFAHGYVAYRLGDPTAKAMGRLTFNPFKHLDPVGTIVFFFINFGWAKPVPVNATYFGNPKKGMLWVALAGPLANLTLAVFSAIAVKMIIQLAPSLPPSQLLGEIIVPLFKMLKMAVILNLALCIFNFLPIPPLDGSRILMGILPDNMARTYASYERYGFILILLLAFTGLLSKMIMPVISLAGTLLLP